MKLDNSKEAFARQWNVFRHGFRPTNEDWYPTMGDGFVSVSVIWCPCYIGRPENWRVLVKGGDDFGMEKDFLTKEDAVVCLDSLPIIITKADLIGRGFQYA